MKILVQCRVIETSLPKPKMIYAGKESTATIQVQAKDFIEAREMAQQRIKDHWGAEAQKRGELEVHVFATHHTVLEFP